MQNIIELRLLCFRSGGQRHVFLCRSLYEVRCLERCARASSSDLIGDSKVRTREGRTDGRPRFTAMKKSAAAPPQSIANCARKTCHARARGRRGRGRGGGGTALTPSRWHKEKEKCFSLYSWTKAERFLMERLSLRTPRIAARSTVPFQFLLGNTLAGEERSLPPMLYRGS